MPVLPLADRLIRYSDTGSGAPVLLLPPLGMPRTMWDGVALPGRLIAPDLRGAPMGALVRDAEALLDALALRDAVVVGAGLGGLVAQGLAVKRLDLVRGLVLMNTAAKIPATAAWRAQQVGATDMTPLIPRIIERAFAPAARRSPAALRARDLLAACDPATYAAGAAAIEGTDFYTTTATLTLPALVLAGQGDGITPPDLVAETADLMRGAELRLMHGSGHYPALDAPEALGTLIRDVLSRIGH